MAAAPPQRDRRFEHVAERHAALQEPRRLARRHEVAIGEALVDRLEHVEQHQAGDEVGPQPGEAFDLGPSQAALDRGWRLEQAERAAQHVLADQRRRRRQSGRKPHAAVVERLARGGMAEGDRRHARTRPRRELAAMGAHQPVEAPARQALQAADEEEGLPMEGPMEGIGERQSRLRPQRAALRAAVLRPRACAPVRPLAGLGGLLARARAAGGRRPPAGCASAPP